MTRNLEHVGKPCVGDKRRPCAFTLERRIGCNRAAVHNMQGTVIERCLQTHLANTA